MSISYVNVYEVEGKDYACEFWNERTPKDAQFYAVMPQNAPTFRRVEMRFDQHWHRPPVGIKADQCSHQWIRRFYITTPGGSIVPGPWELETRKPKAVRLEGEDLELA